MNYHSSPSLLAGNIRKTPALILMLVLVLSDVSNAELSPTSYSELMDTAASMGAVSAVGNHCGLDTAMLSKYIVLIAVKYYGASRTEVQEALLQFSNAGKRVDMPRVDCDEQREILPSHISRVQSEILVLQCWAPNEGRSYEFCIEKHDQ